MADEEDEISCPITCEYFRNPVTAEDNRVYERDAIVKWINEHGTSPFTRQVLHIDRLVPNERIKKLADKHRRLSVSYSNRSDGQVVLPPLTPVCANVLVTVTEPINNPVVVNDRLHCLRSIRCSRICESIRNTYSSCCSLHKCSCIFFIILFTISALAILSILIYSIVTNIYHGSS